MNIILSPALEDDFEELLALRIDAMRESLQRIGRFDPARARERFRAGFSASHTRHIRLDKQGVGFVVMKPEQDRVLLDHLYIHPDFHNRGIGSAVLAEVFKQADALSLPIHVCALRESAANRFYRRHGFSLSAEEEWDLYYIRLPKNSVL